MREVFFASGATAVATMGGVGAWSALADDTTTADASATASPSAAPSGDPGSPGSQTITEDFFAAARSADTRVARRRASVSRPKA
jgi:hypothetical protein